jgi:hypothetical protein
MRTGGGRLLAAACMPWLTAVYVSCAGWLLVDLNSPVSRWMSERVMHLRLRVELSLLLLTYRTAIKGREPRWVKCWNHRVWSRMGAVGVNKAHP